MKSSLDFMLFPAYTDLMMKLFVFGTQGRMSRATRDLALLDPHIQLLHAPERHCSIIDFTAPPALESNLSLALEHQSSYMVGTTGLHEDHFEELRCASKQIPILWTSNTSLGANLLFELTHLAAKILSDFQVSIHDLHHAGKKDSPSGTALSLQKAVGRDCKITSTRAGEVIGLHEVLFSGPYEMLSLKHEVSDRKVFARGAILASFFLSKQRPGLYTMKDVLRLPK